ncbi:MULTISPECIES: DUF1657 domain-containing protein [Alteribacter]|nr:MULTISPECIES: DUF1657 domain-containing protein [Alteribacter]MBM7094717.1 DUF1657 domain-containing protein [Alteribacter salitolerans]
MPQVNQVKACLASLKSLEAGLNELQIQTTDEDAHDVFREGALKVRTIAREVEDQIHVLELNKSKNLSN